MRNDQDLCSTNGTYVINVETEENTRLTPKKAMMLPEGGCNIRFGSVICKVPVYLRMGEIEEVRLQTSATDLFVCLAQLLCCGGSDFSRGGKYRDALE